MLRAFPPPPEGISVDAVTRTGEQRITIAPAIEDVMLADWVEKVYGPDIIGQADKLYKKPGYDPLK